MSSYSEHLGSVFKALANTCSLPIPRCDFLFKKYTGRVPITVADRVLSFPGTETSVKQSPLQVGSCVSSALTLQVSLQQVCSLQQSLSIGEMRFREGPRQQLSQVWVPLKTTTGLEDLLEASIILAAKARLLILLIFESEIVMHHSWSEALAILGMDSVILIYTCIFSLSC